MNVIETQCVVIGAGPGGYTAAFSAADHGLKTLLIERYQNLGGVCLNVGCIPSKALLHIAALKEETRHYQNLNIGIKDFKINIEQTRQHKEGIVKKLNQGISHLAKARQVQVLHGIAEFLDQNNLIVKDEHGSTTRVVFAKAIIAAGSRPIIPKSLSSQSPRVMTSTGALNLPDLPSKLLVIGGGIIGLEMGYVYASFGSKVTVVEALPELAAGIDRDVFSPLAKKLKKLFTALHTHTLVTSLKDAGQTGITASFKTKDGKETSQTFDRVLISVGRRPNSDLLALEKVGLTLDDLGMILVDPQMRTNVPNIFAIGDITGNPMLAHKASRQAHIAALAALGQNVAFDNLVIPNVLYTDPEIAWAGLTETQASAQKIPYKTSSFPWTASGRALAISKTTGSSKILYHPETERILGVAICGSNAGELIAEAVLAIEMGAVLTDITETIHAHPTLSETFLEAAQAAHGLAPHYISPKK